jgi:hypothetical protein
VCERRYEASSGRVAATQGHDKLGDRKVVLIGGSHRWHSGSRGGHRVKCDKEKAKVKFALMMEVAQGILMVRKPWAAMSPGVAPGAQGIFSGGPWPSGLRPVL